MWPGAQLLGRDGVREAQVGWHPLVVGPLSWLSYRLLLNPG